jgi:hypothetical protein
VGLSDDQKAMLRLLSQRGEQGYEDIAALKGLSVEEVSAQAREAVAQLEAEGIPAPAIPSPPGGTGEPKSPSEPSRSTEKAAPAPKAEKSAFKLPKPRKGSRPRGQLKLPSGGQARAALLAGGAAVVILVVILLVGGSGGGSGGSSGGETTAPSSESASGTNTSAQGGKEVTEAILNPVDGSNAKGVVVFGRVKSKLALQVAAEKLEPSAQGETYTVWLWASEDKMLPLASAPVTEKGVINAQVVVPTEILAYLANETFTQIAITRTDKAQLAASLAKATKAKKAPEYTGTEVLRGTVTGPIVGAANREGKAESE